MDRKNFKICLSATNKQFAYQIPYGELAHHNLISANLKMNLDLPLAISDQCKPKFESGFPISHFWPLMKEVERKGAASSSLSVRPQCTLPVVFAPGPLHWYCP